MNRATVLILSGATVAFLLAGTYVMASERATSLAVINTPTQAVKPVAWQSPPTAVVATAIPGPRAQAIDLDVEIFSRRTDPVRARDPEAQPEASIVAEAAPALEVFLPEPPAPFVAEVAPTADPSFAAPQAPALAAAAAPAAPRAEPTQVPPRPQPRETPPPQEHHEEQHPPEQHPVETHPVETHPVEQHHEDHPEEHHEDHH